MLPFNWQASGSSRLLGGLWKLFVRAPRKEQRFLHLPRAWREPFSRNALCWRARLESGHCHLIMRHNEAVRSKLASLQLATSRWLHLGPLKWAPITCAVFRINGLARVVVAALAL